MSQYLIPTYARQPLAFVRGEGVWLYDEAGHKYMDVPSPVSGSATWATAIRR